MSNAGGMKSSTTVQMHKRKEDQKKNHYENTFMFLANRTSASTLNWTHEKPHNFKAASVKFTILKIMHNTIKS